MKIAGIICEYNPFHNGHEYLVKRAKADGYALVAVMSGNYTQRGELAIADKYTRAEAAIKCGADLVLELPFPFCMSSAEFFAKGGVSVLERVGATRIYFGSECGDIEFIKKAAKVAASEEFLKLRERSSPEDGTAKSHFETLEAMLGDRVTLLSNDILGVEYVKELNRRKMNAEPMTVKRLGDSYRADEISSEFASATAIRNLLRAKDTNRLEKYMPSPSVEVIGRAIENASAPADIKRLEAALLSFWRLADPHSLSHIAELGNGLEYRIKDAALSTNGLSNMEQYIATKKYTSARIRRAMLFGMLGVTRADLDAEPEYTSVLGANAVGREILSAARKSEGELKIITKQADAPDCRQLELSARADALYTLALPETKEAGYFAKKKIYIE